MEPPEQMMPCEIRLTTTHVAFLDRLVTKGIYRNRSEAVRYIIMEFISRYNGGRQARPPCVHTPANQRPQLP